MYKRQVETEGRIRRWEKSFESREQLLELIRQIVSRVNRTVNTASPIVDARLEDGSRVHVVLEPVALNGPILTIRKFPDPITMDRLLEYGSVTRAVSYTHLSSSVMKPVPAGLPAFFAVVLLLFPEFFILLCLPKFKDRAA